MTSFSRLNLLAEEMTPKMPPGFAKLDIGPVGVEGHSTLVGKAREGRYFALNLCFSSHSGQRHL